ncbi:MULTISPECIES: ArsR/SmtB family transcription factor [Paraburkholderia]|uniref:ArsR/SmtB family transcription factor n=1 Tax=Paraburkholderia TaxID=1822464 RepID=UPI000368F1F6|nr:MULTISPECIES: metalloregulator ArsR/SmtB family transcription factor [Paraburkholderia]MDH6153455.1 DNA-binding transcriptional ArsR family regulator [Paraburkholderia sp. WSM4179]
MANTTPRLEALKQKAPEAAELLRLLANASRLQLLSQIALGERSVSQLERELDIQQPALSQQLAELRKAGLVKTRRASRSIFYSVADARTELILEMLRTVFCDDGQLPASRPATAAREAPTQSAQPVLGDVARFARLG